MMEPRVQITNTIQKQHGCRMRLNGPKPAPRFESQHWGLNKDWLKIKSKNLYSTVEKAFVIIVSPN